MDNIIIIESATLVLPDRLKEGSIVIADGKIAEIGDTYCRTSGSCTCSVYKLPGLYLSPGFIDLQVNGGAGYNFNDAPVKGIKKILEFHISNGTTGILATIITAPSATMASAEIQKIREFNYPAILGVHLEGPFISKDRKGAHNPEHILLPSVEQLEEILKGHEKFVKMITLAPELSKAEALITKAQTLGIIVALGHSNATYENAMAAIKKGVKFFTHLGNAMSDFHHREPGAVGAALDSDVYVGLICDGIHLHPAFIRLVAKVKGYDRICLVTDAISATGLPDGDYLLGGLPVVVQNGVAGLSKGTLAGSTLTMNRAVKNFMEFTGCSLPEAVRCATINPARLLGIDDRKGSIEIGKDADLVVFDADFNVHYTILGGKIVHARY